MLKRYLNTSILTIFIGMMIPAVSWADPIVNVHGDTVDVWVVNWYDHCAFQAGGTVTQVADTFYIVWADTCPDIATCTCWFDLKATLVDLPAGTYWAKTWVGTQMNFTGDPLDTVYTGMTQFNAGAQNQTDPFTTTWQSPCHTYEDPTRDFYPLHIGDWREYAGWLGPDWD